MMVRLKLSPLTKVRIGPLLLLSVNLMTFDFSVETTLNVLGQTHRIF